jgi:uncharacterized protein YcbK (DUF882 family)
MSISLKELIKNANYSSLSPEIQGNLMVLLERVNRVRDKFGKPMTVTSGLRTMEDHLRIYRQKGITDKSKIPMKSRHLVGAACDVADPKGELQKWCKDNEQFLADVGLWCEDFASTHGWCHFQIFPPASGKRFFKP